MKNPIKTFEPNLLGRDFAIGDLHGAMPCFQNLLKNINFDTTKDRMFSVGDLVDRGPQSHNCLSLIREPWFHSTLSNHEQMMLEAFRGGKMGDYWLYNGGTWGLDALVEHQNKSSYDSIVTDESADILDLVNLVEELPFLITINHKNGKKFHILHAELPPQESNSISDEVLKDPDQVLKLATTKSNDGDAFLWARYMFYNFSNTELTTEKITNVIKNSRGGVNQFLKLFNDDRSHVISGHTIVREPLTLLNHTNIDTCAYGACHLGPKQTFAGLTCVELDTWTFYKATPENFEEIKPITVNKLDLTS